VEAFASESQNCSGCFKNGIEKNCWHNSVNCHRYPELPKKWLGAGPETLATGDRHGCPGDN
jgi:hypothetical protein